MGLLLPSVGKREKSKGAQGEIKRGVREIHRGETQPPKTTQHRPKGGRRRRKSFESQGTHVRRRKFRSSLALIKKQAKQGPNVHNGENWEKKEDEGFNFVAG